MDIKNITKEEFLKKNRISDEDWDKAEINFEKLKKIGEHHENNKEALNKAAEYIAARLQRFPEVHSVRWRVKDPFHLMEKIVRKRKSKTKKYLEINEENYTEVITDLIGVRVIHLFKHEWESIHDRLLELWKKKEKPVAYVRSGDEKELTNSYTQKGCKVEVHPSAYRSIHYIISTEATKNKILTEIQVRTIFEEGWSEIDHKIRYPNFTTNENIASFLKIFNRLAGSADEMGTFINNLNANLKQQELESSEQNREHERLNQEIAILIEQLNENQTSNKNNKETINKLKNEIEKLNKNQKSLSERKSSITISPSSFGSPTIEAFKVVQEIMNAYPSIGSAIKAAQIGNSLKKNEANKNEKSNENNDS